MVGLVGFCLIFKNKKGPPWSNFPAPIIMLYTSISVQR